MSTHSGIGKRKKGRGPATKKKRTRLREAAEAAEAAERARRRRFFADRYDR